MVTIRDVAQAAGVSTATVSRYLSGHKVQQAQHLATVISQLGYQPNHSAASLRTGKHRTIGVISPDTANPLLAEIVHGVQTVAREHGYRVLVGDSNEDSFEERQLMVDLTRRVDGLLVFPINEEQGALDQPSEHPLVLIDRDSFSDEPHDFVSVDNAKGAKLAVEHLVNLGHTQIATITGPMTSFPGRVRYEGFVAAMQEAGLCVPPQYATDGAFQAEGGAAAMAKLLGLPTPPSAVFVANNAMSIGAYEYLRRHGVGIGTELSLVGFDDFRLADLLSPALTVIDRPTFEQGAVATRLLFDRINQSGTEPVSPPTRVTLDVSLTVRDSTGPARS